MSRIVASDETSTEKTRVAKGDRPRLLIIGPLPPPFIGPAVATGRLLASEVLGSTFDIDFLDIGDAEGADSIGRFSTHNIVMALRHGAAFLGKALRHRPDAVYIPIDRAFWGFLRDLLFIIPSKVLGIKVIVHLRAGRFDLIHDFGRTGKLLARIGLSCVDQGIVLGQMLRGVYGGRIAADRVHVVPNGIDLGSWPDPGVQREEGEFRIAYIANLFRNKGAYVLLSALPRIRQIVPNVKVTFAGAWFNEEYKAECLAIIERHGLHDCVDFAGSLDEQRKKELLRRSDLSVFVPVKPEGLPWVVLEAMACSLPVVASPQGTIPEVVVDGTTGLLVPSGDADALANAVIRLALDRDLRWSMGREGRLRIESIYSEEVTHRMLADVIIGSCAG